MLDWFTTIPGILIICGVILLIIAIILFILGAKKSKKEVVANSEPVINSVESTPIESASTIETVAESTPVEPVTVESVNPSVDITTDSTDGSITIEEPVQISEQENAEVVTQDTTVNDSVIDTSVMDMPSVTEIPVVEENNSTIYGGEVPVVDFSVSEEKPVTIYGGNDPLEATQALPKVEEHHEPYGGSYPEVRIVDPVQTVEMPTPVEEVVSAMPTVESVPVTETENAEVTSDVVEPTPITIPSEEESKTIVEEL